jgi:murein DD-endopeptidase MepM/ murein hydrolase activator NlpD
LRDFISPHSGVDFGGRVGDPVIAPADGVVIRIWRDHDICGNGLLMNHKPFGLFTIYCHMHEVSVSTDQEVNRGEPLGSIGESGSVAICRQIRSACPIVHWELTKVPYGNPKAVPGVNSDPLAITVGCFDRAKAYPIDRLVFTYPVPCRD